MRTSYLLPIAFAVILSSCSEQEKKSDVKTAPVITTPVAALPPSTIPKTVYDEEALSKIRPSQFIDSLKAHTAESFVTVKATTKKWITAADMKELMPLIESTEACAGVVSTESNNVPPANIHSTVGVEAMMLIEGFRNKKYPAYNTSVEFGKGMQMDKKNKRLVIFPNSVLVEGEKEWFKKMPK